MATTSLWRVKGWLGKVLVYVQNPDKVKNPKFIDNNGMDEKQLQNLQDVISYAVNSQKTTLKLADENEVVVKEFVSGVNVMPQTARETMMDTKRQFDKTGGTIAYHGYQAFAPGEGTPEMAHEIGVKLAKQLWGDRYQVLVTTHLDKGNHLHNHFVINTVSFVDGKKFYRSEQDYYNMQKASDVLCREYGLSVVKEPQRGKSKHYSEWQADAEKCPTYRNLIKTDVDAAIRQSITEWQLWDNLRKKGYHIKFGQDITLRPEGKERGLKLKRNFGDDYSIEAIRRRIIEQKRPELPDKPPQKPQPRIIHYKGSWLKTRRRKGLRALYYYYLYRLGVFPKKREPNPKQVYFLLREDIRYIQNIFREARLLARHSIDTLEQLQEHKTAVTEQINAFYNERRFLRHKLRNQDDAEVQDMLKYEIATLSKSIKDLRREVLLCDDILRRSLIMQTKLRQMQQAEQAKVRAKREKELNRHESFGRCS